MIHALRMRASIILLAVSAPSDAAIIEASAANLKAAFAAVNAGDTIRVTGSVGSMTFMNRSFATQVTIDATNATFTDTLTVKNVSGLVILGGTFGSATTPMRAGRAVTVYSGSNILFSKNKFIGNGLGMGLTFAGSSDVKVSAGTFSGLKLGIGITSSENVRVSSSRFTNMSSDGINIADSHYVTATANRCTGSVPALGAHPDCIQLWSVLGRPIQSDITLMNNIVSGDTQGLTSFDIENGGGLRITMTGNTISTSFPQGLACYGCFDSVFTGNVLTTLPGSPWRTSMNIVGGGNNIISNNSIGALPVSSAGTLTNNSLPAYADTNFDDYDEPLPDFVIEDMAYYASLDNAGAFRSAGVEEPQLLMAEAASAASVPDLSVWSQLLMGFTLAGLAIRRRQSPTAAGGAAGLARP